MQEDGGERVVERTDGRWFQVLEVVRLTFSRDRISRPRIAGKVASAYVIVR